MPTWPRKLVKVLKNLPAIIAGQVPDTHGIRRAFMSAFVTKLMEKIHDAFERKSKGETDELGHAFLPLSARTIKRKSTPKFRRKYPNAVASQIMRASDRLMNSLGPGRLVGIRRYPPPHQVVEFHNEVVRIYSDLTYADKQFSMRPFYPDNMAPWIDEAIEAGNDALIERLKGLQES